MTTALGRVGGYQIDIVLQGYPGKAVCHGGLGWSTIALLRGNGRIALIDVGTFGMRKLILDRLAKHGLKREEVTDVVLTHSHHDHAINWVMFPAARVTIGGGELAWALEQPLGLTPVAEFYMTELARSPCLHRATEGEEVLPGLIAHVTPGHTPGSVVYVLAGAERDIVFTGDAAKNRAELLQRKADLTEDAAASRRSFGRIWELWQRRPNTILVPGHDVPMVLENGQPSYIGKREAAISAWFGDTLDRTTLFQLTVG
jgi:N-acyl homoserine lactone hydrolase